MPRRGKAAQSPAQRASWRWRCRHQAPLCWLCAEHADVRNPALCRMSWARSSMWPPFLAARLHVRVHVVHVHVHVHVVHALHTVSPEGWPSRTAGSHAPRRHAPSVPHLRRRRCRRQLAQRLRWQRYPASSRRSKATAGRLVDPRWHPRTRRRLGCQRVPCHQRRPCCRPGQPCRRRIAPTYQHAERVPELRA